MSSWYYIVIQVIMLYEERTEYMIQKMDETIQQPLANYWLNYYTIKGLDKQKKSA